jgi:5-dehydro-2-deoxygluconokinase
MTERALDVVTVGRVSVDLYGQQVGGRLEDMASFAKYVGGCPANIAIGAARLGLRSALISRVGDEHMGRFIREQLAREGVETKALVTDPARLTALVILGIRDRETFPLIFYRENCADMALTEADIDEGEPARDGAGATPCDQDRPRYRLPTRALGVDGPWAGRAALRGQRECDGASSGNPA